MDPIKIEKLQAMNKYKRDQLLNKFILYFFTASICALFCSSPLWFPSLCSSMRLLLFVHLPKIGSFIFHPKYLFIICNLIIAILVGESKLTGSHSSSAISDTYDVYVRRNQSLRRCSITEEQKPDTPLIEEGVKRGGEDGKGEGEEDDRNIESDENLDEEEEEEEEAAAAEEESDEMPAEEFKRMVDDFIAKVNKQRWLEAKELVCCSA
ncbi:PREDICTED: uncharacterized protein LOC104593268 [Nelumbo nucifera]|uniref:DUF4408 domain-containing protein n=2 Tax=Nelumbo nucifera TaxID=4432 RepID=A0A822YNU6_NELNU|nr:PREDICTED: uncharacterized protein LOC104593268 [Nelumbo nucifera]DAD34187.1 TPA_asm: hypothetical protein HUJ06_004827 [Nelumbo nucifera]